MRITWYWEQTFTCNKIQNSRARFLVRKLKCFQHFQKWIDIHDHLNCLYMYLSIIIITIPHKTMNKSVLTSSWKGMRIQTLEQNREWRFIRRYICTSIVITTCLWCYITIVKKIQRIKLIKRIQLGFFYSNIKFIRIKLQCFPNQSIKIEGLLCMLCKEHSIQ